MVRSPQMFIDHGLLIVTIKVMSETVVFRKIKCLCFSAFYLKIQKYLYFTSRVLEFNGKTQPDTYIF